MLATNAANGESRQRRVGEGHLGPDPDSVNAFLRNYRNIHAKPNNSNILELTPNHTYPAPKGNQKPQAEISHGDTNPRGQNRTNDSQAGSLYRSSRIFPFAPPHQAGPHPWGWRARRRTAVAIQPLRQGAQLQISRLRQETPVGHQNVLKFGAYCGVFGCTYARASV